MQQPMQNPKDISDPTTALDMALELMSKAFQLNNATTKNNNEKNLEEYVVQNVDHWVGQQCSRNQGTQNVGNQNGLSVVPGIANQHGNGNVIAARAEAYLQTQLQIAQKDEAGIQLNSEEFDFMAVVGAYDKIEKVTANCNFPSMIQMYQLSVEQIGGTVEQHLVNVEETRVLYDSLYNNLSIEVEKFISVNRNTIVTLQRVVKQKMALDIHNWSSSAHQEIYKIVKDEIFPIVNQVDARMQNFEIQFLKEAAKFVRDFKSLAKEADESLAKHKALELEIERLLRAVVLNYAKENAHLKTTYKNLFDSIKVTRAQTKAIIDSLQDKLHDTVYENAKLRAQIFDKFFEQKDTNKVIPKVGKLNALSKLVTSNSAPSSRESTIVNNERVIAPGIFRINPFKASRVYNFVPNKHVKASIRKKPITVSQPHVVTKEDVNSNRNGFSPNNVESTTKTRKPNPRNNPKIDKSWKVYAVICSTNYSNGENQVVSKSFAVTIADTSDKRQQQQDSTSSTSTLTTTISVDGNFDF
ncbi:hypothetical protein Tco_0291363 [Tanacetum coccineum]